MSTWISRTLRLVAALLAAFAVLGGRNLNGILTFSPIPQILFGVLLIWLFFLREPVERLAQRLLRIPGPLFLFLAMALAFGLMALAASAVLDRVPHVTDDVAYYFMAKLMAHGRLTLPATDAPEFFTPHFFYEENGQLISLFQVGWPAVLALGVVLGCPWLVNPLLGALTLWPIYRIARRGYGEGVARLALVMLLASPFTLFIAASMMSHVLAALLSLWALDLSLGYKEDPRPFRLPLTAALVGMLFCVRAYNAMLLLLPLSLIWMPFLWRHKLRLREIAFAVMLGLVFASVQLAVNTELTGSPLMFPQDRYFAKTEEKPHCHQLGFGPDIGCEGEHGQFGFPKGFTPRNAVEVTKQRIDSLSLNFYGMPLVLLLVFVPLLFRASTLTGRALYLHMVSLVGGYFFFYYHGNCFGPRFYYEALGALGILLAAGFLGIYEGLHRLGERWTLVRSLVWTLAPTLLATVLIFSVCWLSPKLWDSYQNFRGINGEMKSILEHSGLKGPAIVLMPGNDANYAFGFNYRDASPDADIVFARHHFEQSAQLMYFYPEREFYRFEPYRRRIVKLKKLSFDGVIFIEMESKFPAYETRGGFATHQSLSLYKPDARDPGQLYFKALSEDAFVTVEQFIFEPGAYRVEFEYMTGPYLGDFRLEVNGAALYPDIHAYRSHYGFERWMSEEPVILEKGPALFRFQVLGKDSKSRGYGLGIDTMTLRRVPDGLDKPIPTLTDIAYLHRGQILPIGPEGIPEANLKRRDWP